ncbi:Holliday junction resolvase RuvX [Chloroflexota bacterium]
MDIGDRRIGLALSDPGEILATPLTIVERINDADAIRAITDIVEKNQVGKIIAGLPVSMDGSLGAQVEKVKTFVAELGKHTTVPIKYSDERLSTISAREIRQKKGKPDRSRDDAVAAAFILQWYLDEFR